VNVFARDEFIRTCKKLSRDETEKLLLFDKKGGHMVEKFMRSIDANVGDASSNFEKEYLSKLGSLFGSMIVILHQLTEKKNEVIISTQTIKKAMNITNTATANAFHLFDIEYRENAQLENSISIIEAWMNKHARTYFKKNDKLTASYLRNAMRRKVSTMEIVEYFKSNPDFMVEKENNGHCIIPV
jgi:hypothetical protein